MKDRKLREALFFNPNSSLPVISIARIREMELTQVEILRHLGLRMTRIGYPERVTLVKVCPECGR